MKAEELIQAKQDYDYLKAHFRAVIASEIMVELALPKDMVFDDGDCRVDGYLARDKEVMRVLLRHAEQTA